MAGAGDWLKRASGLTLSQTFLLLGRSGNSRYELSDPMAKVATVYSGIMAIAQTMSGLPMTLHRGDAKKPITSGPAFDLMNRPMRGETWQSLCEQVVGHFIEGGEFFVFDPLATFPPKQLLVCGKRAMQPEIRGGMIVWWNFTDPSFGTRLRVLPEDMACRKMFNPYDRTRGLSPLKAATMDIKQSWLASEFNVNALTNGAKPGGVYTVPGQLSEQEKDELRKTIRERYESPENAGRPLLGWGGLDYKDVSGTLADLQLAELKKLSREDILSALGVPPVLAGVFESAHYDVADQAIVIFLLHKLAPLARSIESAFTAILDRIEPGVQITIDTTAHPAMLSLVSRKIDAMKKAIDNGTPYNEAATLVGLQVKPQAWGDKSLVPGGLTPIEDVLAGGTGLPGSETDGLKTSPTDQEEEPAVKEDGDEKEARVDAIEIATATTERREEERLVRAHVPRLRNGLRAHFARQQRQIVANLKRELSDGNKETREQGNNGLEAHTTIHRAADENERIAARVLLDLQREIGRMRLLVRNNFPAAVEAALRQKLAALGIAPDAIDKTVKRLMEGKTVKALIRIEEGKIAGVERTTRVRVKKQILEGLSKGETVSQISDRVRVALGGADADRALTIARTEIGQAVSTGRHFAMSTAGVKGKSWLTGRNPRDSHALAGVEYSAANPIAIERPFRVGESYLMYPRDPRGAAGEIINCNCVEIPRRLPAKK